LIGRVGLSHSRSLEELEGELKAGQLTLFDRLFEVIREHERLAGRVYALRQDRGANRHALEQAEEILADSAQRLALLQVPETDPFSYVEWVNRYRRVWRDHFGLFLFTVMLFLASCLIGWQLGHTSPRLAGILLSQPMVEHILDHEAWFAEIQKNPIMSGLTIGMNNIGVAIKSYVGGALLGIGGLYLLIYNGLLFGDVLGFCGVNGFDRQLLGFVSSHGPLELTIIVAATFASFVLGREFYVRPYGKGFGKRLGRAARDSGVLVSGILPWLVLAATLEAFVSPWPDVFGPEQRVLLGLSAAGAFWLWSLAPPIPRIKGGLKNRVKREAHRKPGSTPSSNPSPKH
jgi:uncharacterized membrane protein SpoIIM required for sporulation